MPNVPNFSNVPNITRSKCPLNTPGTPLGESIKLPEIQLPMSILTETPKLSEMPISSETNVNKFGQTPALEALLSEQPSEEVLKIMHSILPGEKNFVQSLFSQKEERFEDILGQFGPELTQLIELHTLNVKIVEALKAQGDKVYEKFVEVIMSGKGKKEVLDMLYGPGKEKDSTVNKLLKTLKDNNCTILDFIPLQEK